MAIGDDYWDHLFRWSPTAATTMGDRRFDHLLPQADAEARLGSAFDLPAFHEVVLESGAVPLALLGKNVAAWVEGH